MAAIRTVSGVSDVRAMVHRCVLVLPVGLTALALLLSGCGASSEGSARPGAAKTAPGVGADTPQAAVTDFLAAAGHPGEDFTRLEDACRRIAPSVRPALRFEQSVTPSDKNCAAALSLMLLYAGDIGDFDAPTGLSGKVTGVREQGERAVVDVAMTYEGASNPGADRTRVLTIREHGAWWIATPFSFNVRSASEPPGDGELDEEYRQLVDAAAKADGQNQSGRDAATEVDADPQACPTDGASSAQDADEDVKVADGMRLADQQPGAHDLTAVTHNLEGSDACFELHFAADAPEEGGIEIAVRPEGHSVQVRWADGEAVGEAGSYDEPVAVKAAVARAESTMTFRLPSDSLGIGPGPYRWAVELNTPTDEQRIIHYDSVPDDMTITGDQDRYILHSR
jgi:hypothetical protein